MSNGDDFYTFKISNTAFKYLHVQRGEISDALENGRSHWNDAYNHSIADIMKSIRPALPPVVNTVLDVGSGMGGLNIMLDRFYHKKENVRPRFWLLDGIGDDPVAVRYPDTFSNFRIAKRFLMDNGLGMSQVNHIHPRQDNFGQTFDLIVSWASWCFHYPPDMYLDRVLASCHDETILILDVRTYNIRWLQTLLEFFDIIGTVYNSRKLVRHVFKKRMPRNAVN
jgi:SAM-dependent methyltransferase